MSDPQIQQVQPWAPHPAASPRTERNGDRLAIAANGTRTCSGGWQLSFSGISPGSAYRIHVDVEHFDVPVVRDSLQCLALWGDVPTDSAERKVTWDYLIPEKLQDGCIRFSRNLEAPQGADILTLRYCFRWASEGRSVWQLPRIEQTQASARRAVRLAVVTGRVDSRPQPPVGIQDNVHFYGDLCKLACDRRPDIIVLPEIAVQWQVNGSPLDLAVSVPSTETDAFSEIAERHRTHILLGLLERDEDAVYNSAVLIGPDGGIESRYRKVHLAVAQEGDSGILPGDRFEVIGTDVGRIGCNICMDSSAAESARMVGLLGADFLLLPIMGDHRAARWSRGASIFNESRWKAIMRTRALDNQLCLAAARNTVVGSCIIDRKGDILAWNEGDEEYVDAVVQLDDGYRTWNGGCFRAVNWMQRRPHLYCKFIDESNVGSL
jgi:predicted amidohydrolase